jgi:hypothetical protein
MSLSGVGMPSEVLEPIFRAATNSLRRCDARLIHQCFVFRRSGGVTPVMAPELAKLEHRDISARSERSLGRRLSRILADHLPEPSHQKAAVASDRNRPPTGPESAGDAGRQLHA